MFKKEYQGGSHVMVLSAQGKDPTAHCKLTGSVSLRYEKGVRGYVHVLEGDSITTRLQLPANERASLGLQQPFLVLQAAVQRDARFAVELCLQDGKGGRRRVNFSSSVKEPAVSTLIARVPFVTMATGQWCNYCFDLPSLMGELFPGHAHKLLESFVVGGACLLRRVFTMRERPREGEELISGGGVRDIPQACQMMVDHTPIPTLVMSSVTVDHQRTTADHSGRERVPQSSDHPPTHVAFGKKVAIPDHILSRQAASGSAGNAGKKGRQSGMTSSRQSSAPTSLRSGGVEGAELTGRSQTQSKEKEKREVVPRERRTKGEGPKGKPLAGDELLALDVLGVQRLTVRERGLKISGRSLGSGTGSRQEPEADMEWGQANSSYLDSSTEEEDRGGGAEGDRLFSYFSPPKSTGSSHPPTERATHSARGVQLEQDFLLHDNPTVVGNEQGLPHDSGQSDDDGAGGPGGGTGDDVREKEIPLASSQPDGELNQTRLSDDYDWRQYASQEDTPPPPPISHRGNSITPEPDTSTLSMTERPAAHSLLDSIDTRGMGGALSPDQEVVGNRSDGSDEELELVYDPQLHCFFDPRTSKYYQLAQ